MDSVDLMLLGEDNIGNIAWREIELPIDGSYKDKPKVIIPEQEIKENE